jgi:cell division transport system ATP-binding protein
LATKGLVVIEFQTVSKEYPRGYAALARVSFQIEKAEMVYVTGHSGAGKSTLLKLIAGIERPSQGGQRFSLIP